MPHVRPFRLTGTVRRVAPVWRMLLAVFLLTALPAAAHAAEKALTVAPETIEAIAGTPQIIAISMAGTAAGDRLLVLAPPSIRARILRAPGPAERTEPTWLVEVTPSDALVGATTVAFQIVERKGGKRVATAIVKVDPKPVATVAALVSGEIIADTDTLLDGQSARIALKLTNAGDSPLQVTGIRFFPQASFRGSNPDRNAAHWVLPPRSTIIRPLDIGLNPDQPLVSGKHPLGLVVSLRGTSPAVPWSGDLVVNKELSTGIPGMTEIQSLLQIPSFLILPGFLIVAAFMLIWRLVRGTTGDQKPLEIATSPALWIGAITLSGIVVFAYPAITAHSMGVRRSILLGYDLGDLVRIWLGSIAAGALAAGGVLLACWGYRKWLELYLFKKGEPPLALLERLERMRRSYQLPYVELGGKRLYNLEPGEAADQLWMAPAIKLTALAGKDVPPTVIAASDSGSLPKLIAELRKEITAKTITLGWDDLPATTVGPTLLPRAKLDGINEARLASLVKDQ